MKYFYKPLAPIRLTAEQEKLNKQRKKKQYKTNKFNAAAFDCMQSLALSDIFLSPKRINKHIDNKLDLVFTTENKRRRNRRKKHSIYTHTN